MASSRSRSIVAFLVFAALVYPIQRLIDASSARDAIEDESLYLSNGATIRKLALGYDALLADVYWMRLIQYFGRKVLDDPTVLNEHSERLALLYPLTDIVTDLDPRYTPAYRFGGFFVHDYVDPVKGFALLDKAVQNNPSAWPLYQDLGFLYWSDGRCEEAAETYLRGSQIEGSPQWMRSLAATVVADCGDTSTAREIYLHMLDTATDPRVLNDVRRKLVELRASDEIAALEAAAEKYKEETGHFPASLAALRPSIGGRVGDLPLTFDGRGQPLDPNGAPYLYDPSTGKVTTDPASLRLQKLNIRKRTGS
jgi:hypothetical protein